MNLNHPSRFAGILLAAGRSSRMGAFKPLLPWGSSTVVERCVRMLRDGGVDEIVGGAGHREQDVHRALNVETVNFAHNRDPDSQMGASVAYGIEQLSDEATAALIALVDQPAVPPAVVHSLLESHSRGGARILVPEFQGRG